MLNKSTNRGLPGRGNQRLRVVERCQGGRRVGTTLRKEEAYNATRRTSTGAGCLSARGMKPSADDLPARRQIAEDASPERVAVDEPLGHVAGRGVAPEGIGVVIAIEVTSALALPG